MKSTLSIILASLLFALTGCITIEEEISFNADGSGRMSYKIDMRQLVELSKSLEDNMEVETGNSAVVQDSNEFNFDQDIMASFQSSVDALRNMNGIDNIVLNHEEEGLVEISFDFKDISTLNTALKNLFDGTNDPQSTSQIYSFNKKTLERNNMGGSSLSEDMSFDLEEEGFKDLFLMMGDSFHYRINYHFATPVKVVKSSFGELSSDKKNFSIDLSARDFVESPDAFNCKFKTKTTWN